MDWALAQSHEQAWMATWDQTVRGHGAAAGAEREARR
jgi:hypothetical protein